PNIATSTLSDAKGVNRYFTLTNSGVTATTYNATFNYVAADNDGAATPANYLVSSFVNPTWTSQTVTPTPTNTTTYITGASTYGDFIIAETAYTTYVWNGGVSNDYQVAANWTPSRTPALTDILTFNNGSSINLTNVPTQQIAQFNVTNNTTVIINASNPGNILQLDGYANVAFNIASGSTLNLDNTNYCDIILNESSTVAGSISFTGEVATASTKTLTINGSITFNSSAKLTGAGNFTLGSGATLTTSNAQGIRGSGINPSTGSIQLSNGTTRTFNSTANFVFNGGTQNSGFNNITLSPTSSTINNLTVNTSTNLTAASTISITGELAVNSGSTLNMGTNALTGSTLTTSGTGILQTQNTSGTPLPSGRTWSMEVQYNSASAQTIIDGSYANINGSGGNRTFTNGTISISGTFTAGSGTYTPGTSTINFNGSTQSVPGINYNNIGITASGTKTLNGTATLEGNLSITAGVLDANGNDISLKGDWTRANAATFTPSTGTVTFNGTGAQSITITSGGTAAYNNLTVSKSSGTLTIGSMTSANVAGNLALTTGTLDDGGNTLTLSGNLTGTGTHTGSGKIYMTGSGTTISGASLTNLELDNAGGFSLSGNPAISAALTLTSGALALAGNTLTLANGSTCDLSTSRQITGLGTVAVSNGATLTTANSSGLVGSIPAATITTGATSTVVFNSTSAQNVDASSTYGNLTVTGGSTKTIQGA
ncbi:MAG: beta strand repeat-containing protein, partial [Dolichospermum sp.]